MRSSQKPRQKRLVKTVRWIRSLFLSRYLSIFFTHRVRARASTARFYLAEGTFLFTDDVVSAIKLLCRIARSARDADAETFTTTRTRAAEGGKIPPRVDKVRGGRHKVGRSRRSFSLSISPPSRGTRSYARMALKEIYFRSD